VKSHPKSVRPQLNLALLDRRPVELPQHEQYELALALVELLVNAAAPGAPAGGPNESETYE
jgi:anti-sigma regulatory factor (Ser/Thr protein kinase)